MSYELEYTDKLSFDRQREIERVFRGRAARNETAVAGSVRQQPLLILMLVLLGALGAVNVTSLWSGRYAAVAQAATFAADSRPVPALPDMPPHARVAVTMPEADRLPLWAYESDRHDTGVYPVIPHQVPDAALGTEGATNTTGTLFVAP